jgi:quercetin dioxygenase-like cupin family protein
MKMTVATTIPYARTESAEHSAWYLNHHLVTFLANGEDTGGHFSLMKYSGRKGGEPPPHIHRNEDECFYVLEGEMTFKVGGQTFRGQAGTWVVIPRGVEHTFTIDTEVAVCLVMFTPAGFERYFQEMSEPAQSITMPPAPNGPPDYARLIAVANKYGCEFTSGSH